MSYFVKKRSLVFLLKACDFLLPKSKSALPKTIKKILVCNLAHLGDVITMSYLIPALRKKYPHARIGVLVAKEGAFLIKADIIHTVTHYKHSREPRSLGYKLISYAKELFQAAFQLRKENYDIAIDSYLYMGNSSLILFLAKIPCRIGYPSGGLGALYTDRIESTPSNLPMKKYYLPLLRKLSISDSLLEASLSKRPLKINPPHKFILIHLGSGSSLKRCTNSEWSLLIKELLSFHLPIWIAGKGPFDLKQASELLQQFTDLHNVVDGYSLEELTTLISKSTLVIALDSMAAHLSAACKTPCIQIFTSLEKNPHWEIETKNSYISYVRMRPYDPLRSEFIKQIL